MSKISKNYIADKKRVIAFLNKEEPVLRGSLNHVVVDTLKKKNKLLALAKKYPTPFYAFDQAAADEAINYFVETFKSRIPKMEIFYAVKSNPHEYLLKRVLHHGLGLDVSSGRELISALRLGAERIVFTGPAKTDDELALAIKYRSRITINLDSQTELRRLGIMLRKQKKTMVAGVRIATKYHDTWNKFGIPLNELSQFFKLAKKYPEIKLSGLQCHMSWNKGVEPYQNMIKEIATHLKKLTASQRAQIRFIDIGGGFETYRLEGYFPWTPIQGEVIKAAGDYFGKKVRFSDNYYLADTVQLPAYADAIAESISRYLYPLVDCVYYCEPGRVISTKSMLLVLKVMDMKKKNIAILDGGTNMIGYELFEYFYYPTINVSRPAAKEIACRLYGSLCTPYDLFGYYCYAQSLREGDIIVIPNQGAYTYTLAQNFIKSIPEVRVLK